MTVPDRDPGTVLLCLFGRCAPAQFMGTVAPSREDLLLSHPNEATDISSAVGLEPGFQGVMK